MLSWIIQIFFISILFIFLIHHILLFFKSTLTVPKVKDLVSSSNLKYQNIYDVINNNSNSSSSNKDFSYIDLLPNEDNSSVNMKNELKSFLKKQLNNDNVNSKTDLLNYDTSGIESASSYFSNY